MHVIWDTKVCNTVATQFNDPLPAQARRAAHIPFAASGEYYREVIYGRPAIDRGPGRFSRTNYSGQKVAADLQRGRAHYARTKAAGHHVVMHLQEVSGALYPESERHVRCLAELHRNRLPVQYRGESWTAPTYMTRALQLLSTAAVMGAAQELHRHIIKGPIIRAPFRRGPRVLPSLGEAATISRARPCARRYRRAF